MEKRVKWQEGTETRTGSVKQTLDHPAADLEAERPIVVVYPDDPEIEPFLARDCPGELTEE